MAKVQRCDECGKHVRPSEIVKTTWVCPSCCELNYTPINGNENRRAWLVEILKVVAIGVISGLVENKRCGVSKIQTHSGTMQSRSLAGTSLGRGTVHGSVVLNAASTGRASKKLRN